MRTLSAFSLALLFIVATSGLASPPAGPASRFTVIITVACDDEMLRDQIRSYVARELRELRDVDVAERPPARGAVFGLVISALRVASGTGFPTGWAASWVVTQRIYEPNDTATSIRGVNNVYVNSGVFVGADADLKASMQKAVASFDATTLEEMRSLSRP